MQPAYGQPSAHPTLHDGVAYHTMHQTCEDLAAAQQQQLHESQGGIGEDQHAEQLHSDDFAHRRSAEPQPRR